MNKLKLTRKEIVIQLENRTSQQVKAWVYNDCLAWHKGINGQWILTHLGTGYKLADYYGKYGKLREVTKDVSLVSNWHTTCHIKLTGLAELCQEITRSYE